AAVGHHTNVLPLRIVVEPGEGFRALVRRVRNVFFDAMAHAAVPEEHIAEVVPRARSSWRNRLCRHLFNYFPQGGGEEFPMGALTAEPLVIENGYSKFDLEFFVISTPQTLRLIGRYSTDKLTAEDVAALLRRYEDLLLSWDGDGDGDVDRPTGDIRVWNGADQAVIHAANSTADPAAAPSVLESVYGHVLRTPQATAVVDGERSTTYRDLWGGAENTRARLVGAGVGAGDIVAVAARRSPELVAAVLGIWLTGAAYLPIDPEHPAQRTAYMLDDSGAKVILTQPGDALLDEPGVPVLPMPAVVATGNGEPPLAHRPGRDDPAYLIYTSGSSGRPKGTLIAHRSLSNIAVDYVERLRATPDDVTLWMTTFAFDMANLELYIPLWSGGRIAIAPDEARMNGRVLLDMIRQHDPGIIQATPTTWRAVLGHVDDHLAGRRVVVGAEIVPVSVARQLLAASCEVHHAYGPTETTTWATWAVLPAEIGDRLDVGGPIRNTTVMVVSPDGRELPVGVRGELCIAGDGVALCYHRRPELTAERFFDHPRHGRCYRTGDQGRWRADGTLELFGRADRQIKLRGNRIELGEVEAVLLSHPEVKAVAVTVVGDPSTDARLVAFVETALTEEEIGAVLWEHALAELPHAAIPARFVVVDALPANANEKVDYIALKEMAASRLSTAGSTAEPGAEPDDELVRALLEVWQRFLGNDDLSPDTNFFTHGGHSLLGAQLLQHIGDELGVQLRLADLFDAPTPATLARVIRGAAG
ncbi:MAG TPA: amino acid adenylation domain-containing protein, partial [Nonomuraea sp.]|nr:amino acid adenylation domain-containing protein [Nonomuraea sp.]